MYARQNVTRTMTASKVSLELVVKIDFDCKSKVTKQATKYGSKGKKRLVYNLFLSACAGFDFGLYSIGIIV